MLLAGTRTPAEAKAAPVAAPAKVARAPLALVGATVFDGTGAPPLTDAVVVIEGDRIGAIGPRSKVRPPRGAKTIDLAGGFIVPGLIDTHVHFFQSGGLYTRPDIAELRAHRPYADEAAGIRADLDDTLRRYLVNGVTAVVDVGGPLWNFEVRRRAEQTRMAPRAAVTGPLISTVARPQLDLGDPPIIRADSPAHARALVRAQLPYRPAFIKIWFVLTPERPFDDVLAIARAVIEEAHAAGVRVAAHAMELKSARAVVEAGADVLVHSVNDAEVDDAFVQLLKKRNVILIPTLVVQEGYAKALGAQGKSPSEIETKYGAPGAIASWAEWPPLSDATLRAAVGKRWQRVPAAMAISAKNLRRLAAAGVAIAAGTDAGNIGTLPGVSMHEELQAMVRAGMSSREVLVAATSVAARVHSPAPEIGTLAPGKLADLLVLDADPLADVANLRRLRFVARGGELMRPDEVLPPNPSWIVDRQVEAYNARDLDRFLAYYAPDAVIADHPAGAKVARGRDEMRRTYAGLFAAHPRLHCTIASRTVLGDFVVDRELITGFEGRPYFHGLAMYEVKGGLIRRVWFVGPRQEAKR